MPPSATDKNSDDRTEGNIQQSSPYQSERRPSTSVSTISGFVSSNGKSAFSPTSDETKGRKRNDIESQDKQEHPSTARKWIIFVTIAGLFVSGLVLVIVLYPLLSTKPNYGNQDINILPVNDNDKESKGVREFHRFVVQNIEGAMNISVEPCDDFYEFACGSWAIHNPPPKGVSRWSNFEDMTVTIWDMMEEQLAKIAANANREDNEDQQSMTYSTNDTLFENADPFIVNLVGIYYSTCVNESLLLTQGAAPLMEVLEKLDKMYDTTAKELEPLEVFQKMLEYVHHELSVHAFFSWKVEIDNSIADSMVIELGPPNNDLLPQGTIVEGNEELVAIYKSYAKDSLEILGAYGDNDPETEANIITELLKKYQPLSGSPLVNVTNIYELDTLAPFLNWQNYLNDAFNKIGVSVTADERILSMIQDYLVNISELITTEVQEHGSQRIYLFLRWQVVQYYSQYLHKTARNTILPLFDAITGENTIALPNFRYRPCIKELEERLALPMAYLLLETIKQQLPKRTNIKDMIRNVENMANNIRESYKTYINSFDWLTRSAKKMLLNKLSFIKILVGYPSILDNVSLLQSLYTPLKFDRGNLIQNQISLLKFNQLRRMKFLREPHTYSEWEVLSPMSLISFYVYRRNTLLVPLGGFMYPLFTSDLPPALSYATMGVFISHEIGHAIDFVGRTRDPYGRTNATMWDEATVSDFVQRVLCRVNEYTERYYPVEGLLTIAEVMADDGSVATAYQTIREHLRHTVYPDHIADLMKKLDLSPQQLYFLYYAQLFCTATAPGVSLKGIDHYPPHPIRVRATLAKTPAFHRAFNCPKGSNMNPIVNQTCDIW